MTGWIVVIGITGLLAAAARFFYTRIAVNALAPLGAALLVAAALVVVHVAAAGAQTTGGGFLNGDGLGAGLGVTGGSGGGSGATGGSTGGGGGGSTPTCTAPGGSGPIGYTPVSAATAASLNVAGPRVDELMPGNGILVARPSPNVTLDNPNPPAPDGTWYAKTCGGNQAGYVWAPAGTTPGPPPPPPPPTAAEVRDLTPLPTPAWGVSPIGTGLTGLETWLWDSNGSAGRTVNVVIRGYSVTSNARPTRWTWDLADAGPASRSNPPSTLSSSVAGTATSPAVRYTYETPGGYRIRLTVTWGGSYTYAGNGVGAQTVDLGTTTRTATRDYQVTEVRPVRTAA